MISKLWRHIEITCREVCFSKTVNATSPTDPSYNDDIQILWFDQTINLKVQDDGHTMNHLYQTSHNSDYYIDENKCLSFIEQSRGDNNLFLIVSGHCGENFVPKINNLTQINSIYIFCGRKETHEVWASIYNKVKGVFDKITDLCRVLKSDIQEREKSTIQPCKDIFTKVPFSVQELNDTIHLKHSKHDFNQSNNDIKILSTLREISFHKEENCLPTRYKDLKNMKQTSTTVCPYNESRNDGKYSDDGLWPHLSLIANRSSEIYRQLRVGAKTIHCYSSVEDYFKQADSSCKNLQFVIVFNSTTTENATKIINNRSVQNLYIYDPSFSFQNHDNNFNERYLKNVFILRHTETLVRMVLWNISACLIKIGNDYELEKKKSLAKRLYRLAHDIYSKLESNLHNQIQVIDNIQRIESID